VAVRIAQWFSRIRRFVGGFVEGLGNNFQILSGRVQAVAAAFGIASGPMAITGQNARQLGQTVAALIRHFLEMRLALFAIRAAYGAVTFATQAWNAVMLTIRFARIASNYMVLVGAMKAMQVQTALVNAQLALMRARALAAAAAQAVLQAVVRFGWRAVLIGGGIMVAVALIGLLIYKWDAIGPVVTRVGRAVGGFFAMLGRAAWSVLRAIGSVFAAIGGAIWSVLSAIGRRIAAVFAGPLRIVSVVLRAIVLVLYTVVAGAVFGIGAILYGLFRAMVALGRGIGAVVVGAFKALAMGVYVLWLGAKVVFTGLLFVAKVVFIGLVTMATAAWSGIAYVFGLIGAVAARVWAPVARAVAPVWHRVVGFVEGAYQRIAGVARRIGAVFHRVWEGIKGAARGVASVLADVFSHIGDTLMGALRGIIQQIVYFYRSLPSAAQTESMTAMANDLERFATHEGTDSSKPESKGGAAPAGAQAPLPAPQQAAVNRNVAAAQATGRAAAATVVVNPPPAPPVHTEVVIDGEVVARAVTRHVEDQNLRGGGQGLDD
jgi:phage-related protein